MKKRKKTKLYEWQEKAKEGGICQKCLRHMQLTVDHIVPISFLLDIDDGQEIGYEDEENFELVCERCNKFKGNRLDFLNPKTAQLILKYIKPYLK